MSQKFLIGRATASKAPPSAVPLTAEIFFFFLTASSHDSGDLSFKSAAKLANDAFEGEVVDEVVEEVVEVVEEVDEEVFEAIAFASVTAASAVAAAFLLFSAPSSFASATALAAAAALEAVFATALALLAAADAALTVSLAFCPDAVEDDKDEFWPAV